jgi:hypothetical protein
MQWLIGLLDVLYFGKRHNSLRESGKQHHPGHRVKFPARRPFRGGAEPLYARWLFAGQRGNRVRGCFGDQSRHVALGIILKATNAATGSRSV